MSDTMNTSETDRPTPPSQPVAKDERAGCKIWCGMTVRMPGGVTALEALGYPFGGGERRDDAPGVRWCSPACRDAKHPPLPAPSPARPAVAERTCERWCGKQYIHSSVPSRLDEVAVIFSAKARTELWPDSAIVWCSEECKVKAISPAPSQPAETVKSVTLPIGRIELAKCDRCGKDDGSATMCGFDGRRVLWCTLCHFQAMAWLRRQSNDPVDFGVSLLHNPGIPELRDRRLKTDWIWDTLPDGDR